MTRLDIRIPAILIALAIPLVLRLIPPNPLYGMRTQVTFSSKEVWYRANRLAGIVLIAAMLASLAAKYIATQWLVSQGRHEAVGLLVLVDGAFAILAFLFSYWRVKATYRG